MIALSHRIRSTRLRCGLRAFQLASSSPNSSIPNAINYFQSSFRGESWVGIVVHWHINKQQYTDNGCVVIDKFSLNATRASDTTHTSLTRSSRPSPTPAKRVMQPRARAALRVYNGDARVNATNKFPTSADERNPREFNAARHCRIMLQTPSDAVAYSTRVHQPAVDHACVRVALARPLARALVRARARAHKFTHRVVPTRTQHTSKRNVDNRTCAPAIYKLYARCNRSYKQFNYVYASEITRLSINSITTWRRGA